MGKSLARAGLLVGLLFGSLLAAGSGCTTQSARIASEVWPASLGSHQVAMDFTNVLLQLDELQPGEGALEYPAASTGSQPVLEALKEMLERAGYTTASTSSSENKRVSYSTEPVRSARGLNRLHEVAVGDIGIRRSYREQPDGRLEPVGPMLIRGADARSIQMIDRKLFGVGPQNPQRGEQNRSVPARGVSDDLMARYEEIFVGLADRSVQLTEESQTVASTGTDWAALASNDVPDNVQELGRSNFAEQLQPLMSVIERTVQFERGSTLLGNADVVVIDEILEAFDRHSDVIALTGYSVDGARNTEQNRRMAMQRAEKVKSALTRAGVPVEQVLVEGFWSETRENDQLPTRATHINVWRQQTHR